MMDDLATFFPTTGMFMWVAGGAVLIALLRAVFLATMQCADGDNFDAGAFLPNFRDALCSPFGGTGDGDADSDSGGDGGD